MKDRSINKDKSVKVFQIIIIILLQIICEHYLYFGQYIIISLLPIIILSLPIRTNSSVAMLIAFVIGLVTDILSNSIIGITPASMVILATCRNAFVHSLRENENVNKNSAPTVEIMGDKMFLTYIIVSYIVYISAYNFIEIAEITNKTYFFLRILISSVINIPIAFLISFIIRKM